jgi:stage V sporulation protein G
MEIVAFKKVDVGKIKARVDIRTSEGFVIKGFKVIEGDNGLFVGMPSEKTRTGKYIDLVSLSDFQLKEMLESQIIDYYLQKTKNKS